MGEQKMHKQKYSTKIINIFMFTALLYLSIKVVSCFNSEQDEIEKIIKNKLPSNEITQNNLFNYQISKGNQISPDDNSFDIGSLLINGSFSICLTCFLTWRKLLSAGTV